MRDKHGNEIKLGDILDSDDGYAVIVCAGENGSWFGKLICDPGDGVPGRYSCENIPYALNEGRGYTKRQAGEGEGMNTIAELDELIETLDNKIRLCQNELAKAWLSNQRYLAIVEREEILKQAGEGE